MQKSSLIMLAGVLCTASVVSGAAQTSTLTVIVENITVAKGRVHVGIYKDAATFPKKKYAFAGKEVRVSAVGSVEVMIADLAPGRYAVAVFHDTNDNGKLDTNVFGVPIEPYGFSNKAIAKWGNPKFESAAFPVRSSREDIRIRLSYWDDL
jgi:uncharacterized protein (DUF2141 family)